MQLKLLTQYLILFTFLVSSLRAKALRGRGCYECEEEVWEEVPCGKIKSNSTKTSSHSHSSKSSNKLHALSHKSTTYKPTTPAPNPYTTSPPPTGIYSSTENAKLIATKDPYKKCYCECKLGCKEFCRKVVINPSDKQIVQVSKISEPVDKGHIESTHILQRELIPKDDQIYDNDNYVSSINDEPESKVYSTERPLPVTPESDCEEDSVVDTVDHTAHDSKSTSSAEKNYSKPIVEAEKKSDVPALDSYQSKPIYPPYHRPLNSVDYNFPIPFENVFSKVSKSVQNPLHLPPIQANISPLETHDSLSNVDDPVDSLIMQFMNNPSHNAVYPEHPKPLYSVSYNRL